MCVRNFFIKKEFEKQNKTKQKKTKQNKTKQRTYQLNAIKKRLVPTLEVVALSGLKRLVEQSKVFANSVDRSALANERASENGGSVSHHFVNFGGRVENSVALSLAESLEFVLVLHELESAERQETEASDNSLAIRIVSLFGEEQGRGMQSQFQF